MLNGSKGHQPAYHHFSHWSAAHWVRLQSVERTEIFLLSSLRSAHSGYLRDQLTSNIRDNYEAACKPNRISKSSRKISLSYSICYKAKFLQIEIMWQVLRISPDNLKLAQRRYLDSKSDCQNRITSILENWAKKVVFNNRYSGSPALRRPSRKGSTSAGSLYLC